MGLIGARFFASLSPLAGFLAVFAMVALDVAMTLVARWADSPLFYLCALFVAVDAVIGWGAWWSALRASPKGGAV